MHEQFQCTSKQTTVPKKIDMPTYTYECSDSSCKHTFEYFQTMTSRRKKKCPECDGQTLVRLVGKGAGIIFKGDGFYETDYKRKKK